MGEDEGIRNRFLKDIPLRRFGNPRDIGLVALYLASEASDYMTGHQVTLDGGGCAR